jgi:hypothetical protein
MVKMFFPVLTEVERASVAAMQDAARAVLKSSNQKVPVDDGTLRRSGRVVTEDLEVRVRYRAPHAHLQHERLDYQHPDGGQAKFLEAAVDEVDVERIIAAKVREMLGG